MREWLINRLEFPPRTVLNRKIPKKAFFTQTDLSTSEKELFTSQIEGIYLLSVMNQQSMNIPVYETEEFYYSEVVWIYVQLRNTEKISKIISALHKSIANPVVLIIGSSEGEILLSTCHKRLNKNDLSKVVADQPIITEWFWPKKEGGPYNKLLDSLIISKLSFENMHSIYDDVHQWLKCEEMIPLIGIMLTSVENREKIINDLHLIQEVKKKLNQLQEEQKRQLEFGAKMDLHMEIKRQEQKINFQLQQIRESC